MNIESVDSKTAGDLRRLDVAKASLDPVRNELHQKFPGSENIAELIIELGMIEEKFAEVTKERNKLQDSATPEHNQRLETEISDLNKELGLIIEREDQIKNEISQIWLDNKLNGSGKLPELKTWELELTQIAHSIIDQIKSKQSKN